MNTNKGSFAKGAILGAVAGAIAGILLAPKSGRETREQIAKLTKKWGKEATETYKKAVEILSEKMDAIVRAGKKIDQKKYLSFVTEVVEELKNDKQVTLEAGKRIAEQLKKDWNKVSTTLRNSSATNKN